METKDVKPTLLHTPISKVPQLSVRSSLRGGASIEACEKALEDWKRSYYKWYEAAKYKEV